MASVPVCRRISERIAVDGSSVTHIMYGIGSCGEIRTESGASVRYEIRNLSGKSAQQLGMVLIETRHGNAPIRESDIYSLKGAITRIAQSNMLDILQERSIALDYGYEYLDMNSNGNGMQFL